MHVCGAEMQNSDPHAESLNPQVNSTLGTRLIPSASSGVEIALMMPQEKPALLYKATADSLQEFSFLLHHSTMHRNQFG